MRRKTTYIYVGAILFISYLVQEIFSLKINFLEVWQNNESYRRWSGLVVFLVIAYQWALTLARLKTKNPFVLERFYSIHTWIGAFTPLAFYIHSTKPGFAYLLFLTLAFYANFLLGMFNIDVLKTRAKWYFQLWMVLHVSFSLLIASVTFYHIWIVFYYN
jgi:hypothetical protein